MWAMFWHRIWSTITSHIQHNFHNHVYCCHHSIDGKYYESIRNAFVFFRCVQTVSQMTDWVHAASYDMGVCPDALCLQLGTAAIHILAVHANDLEHKEISIAITRDSQSKTYAMWCAQLVSLHTGRPQLDRIRSKYDLKVCMHVLAFGPNNSNYQISFIPLYRQQNLLHACLTQTWLVDCKPCTYLTKSENSNAKHTTQISAPSVDTSIYSFRAFV